MQDKTMIIIGAGIAGLSTGCYAQMNGYETQIFEMHDKPGGLCTAWQRKGFTTDFCIHHVGGSSSKSALHTVWQELKAFREQDVVFHDEFVRVEEPGGKTFVVYSNLDQLSEHMKELSPADSGLIDEYIGAARLFTRIDLLALPLFTPRELISKMLPLAPAMFKWGKVSISRFAERFSDPFLRRAFPVIQYGIPDVPMVIHLNFLAGCSNQTLGWPKGGSLPFAQAIEERYCSLGGLVHYKRRVEKILVQNGRAIGVALADGSEYFADIVISAADGHATVFDMLEGKFMDDRLRNYYSSAPDYCDMSVHVSLGITREMSGEPHALALFLNEPVVIAGRQHDRFDVEIFNFDSGLAPEGKCVVKVLFGSDMQYWKSLSLDRLQYEEEKRKIADAVIGELDKRFPGIAGQIEMKDVCTPQTIERYTGNWQGFIAPWPPSGGIGAMMKGLSRTLPGLENFYMVGQWGEAMIGISTVAVAARRTVQTLCKKDGISFRVM